jgi:hypothetical protein
VGLTAASLYAVEPLAVVFTARILSETLFTFGVAWLCVILVRWWIKRTQSDLLAAGTLLGFGALVRPILYYAPVILALVVFGKTIRQSSWRGALLNGLLLIGTAAVVLTAWRLRNDQVAGYDGFSGIADLNLRFFRAASVVARRTNVSRESVAAAWGSETVFDSLTSTDYLLRGRELSERLKSFRAAAIPILRHHPMLVAQDAGKGAITTLVGPGTSEWASVLGLTDHLSGSMLTAALALFLAIVWGFAGLGAWWGHRRLKPLVPGLILALYLIAISAGPESYSRFRAPVMPVLCVVAALGLGSARQFLTGITAKEPLP